MCEGMGDVLPIRGRMEQALPAVPIGADSLKVQHQAWVSGTALFLQHRWGGPGPAHHAAPDAAWEWEERLTMRLRIGYKIIQAEQGARQRFPAPGQCQTTSRPRHDLGSFYVQQHQSSL